jgi:transposase-like protein
MTKYTLLPRRPELLVCPHPACGASDCIGFHSQQERRYICPTCTRTFSETTGTLLYGLLQPAWLVLFCQVHARRQGPPAMAAELTDQL